MPAVRLRPVAMADLDRIMSWINDPEVTANIANIKSPVTREEEGAWLERTLKSANDCLWSIEDAATGEYAGQCGIHQIYWPARNGRLAVIIRREFQGRGFGRAATLELLRRGFGELKLHKIWCIVWEDNPKTVHLNRSLGFQQEGRLVDEYCLDGRYHHMLRLYMLESDFAARYPQ